MLSVASHWCLSVSIEIISPRGVWCRASISDLSSIGWFYLSHFFICFVSLIFFLSIRSDTFFLILFLVHQIWHLFSESFFCPSIVGSISWGSGCILIGWLRSFDVWYVGCCCWDCQSGFTSLVGATWSNLCVCWWWTGKINLLLLKSSLLMVWTTRLALNDIWPCSTFCGEDSSSAVLCCWSKTSSGPLLAPDRYCWSLLVTYYHPSLLLLGKISLGLQVSS